MEGFFGGGGGNIRPFSIPLTAAPETASSAFFSVSLVASTGPFCSRAVEEIDRFTTAGERTELRAARRAAMGVMRVIDDMVVVWYVLRQLRIDREGTKGLLW